MRPTTVPEASSVRQVAVVGAGYMGGGIAQSFAMAGIPTVIADADHATTLANHARLLKEAREFEQQGLFDEGAAALIEANMHPADSIGDAVAAADLVEEAVPEIPGLKAEVLSRIEQAADEHTIIATNTSTIPIADLAQPLQQPARFLGVHFSNPAPFIPGVELIAHADTDEQVVQACEELVTRLGKLSARVNDRAGFVLNRLQYVLLKEAFSLVEEGVATPQDIDTIVRTTFGFRLPFFGPFAIADMAGLDVYKFCFATFEEHYGPRMSTPIMLTDLVEAGHLGVKQGGGLVIPEDDPSALVAYRNRAYAEMGRLLARLGPAPMAPDAGTAHPSDPSSTQGEHRHA